MTVTRIADDVDTPPLRRVHPAAVALGLGLLASLQITIETLTDGGLRWSALLEGRVLPALLWVAATPPIMALGRRWPARGHVVVPDLLRHVAAFALWFTGTNVLIRLPAYGFTAWPSMWLDLRAGLVEYLPTSALLWAVLAWLGRVERAAGNGSAAPLLEPRSVADGAPQTLAIPGTNRIHLVPVARIRRLEADGDHVQVHTLDGPHRIRGTLSDFERKLAGTDAFVRIHRSHLVNVAHVREVQPFLHGDYVAVVADGTELPIPRTRRKALHRLLGRE